uniref:Sn-2 protein n=1 Tax=Solanum tuberosum TaxID=4113 RepID=M1D5W0_SOLTU
MGLKGKLISTVEVKCGGHLVHDIFHAKSHHISNISPSKVKSFEIHEGKTVDAVDVGSCPSCDKRNRESPSLSNKTSMLFNGS